MWSRFRKSESYAAGGWKGRGMVHRGSRAWAERRTVQGALLSAGTPGDVLGKEPAATGAARPVGPAPDGLLESPTVTAGDRLLLEEAKAGVDSPPKPTITLWHDPDTVPEPTVVNLTTPEAGR
jgi:hypothetical protein